MVAVKEGRRPTIVHAVLRDVCLNFSRDELPGENPEIIAGTNDLSSSSDKRYMENPTRTPNSDRVESQAKFPEGRS